VKCRKCGRPTVWRGAWSYRLVSGGGERGGEVFLCLKNPFCPYITVREKK
jgi:hypothetical protein